MLHAMFSATIRKAVVPLLAAVAAAALTSAPAAQAQGAVPVACPATFAVLHDDAIGSLSVPAGPYQLTVQDPSKLSCAQAADAFRQFLEDWDGVLPSPWKLNAATATFTGKPGVAFKIARVANPSGGGGGQHPATGALCPGTFQVLHSDHIGSFSVPKGTYTLTLLSTGTMSCATASSKFASFLSDFDGRLPSPWILDQQHGHVPARQRARRLPRRAGRGAARAERRRRDRVSRGPALPGDLPRRPQRPHRRTAPARGPLRHDDRQVGPSVLRAEQPPARPLPPGSERPAAVALEGRDRVRHVLGARAVVQHQADRLTHAAGREPRASRAARAARPCGIVYSVGAIARGRRVRLAAGLGLAAAVVGAGCGGGDETPPPRSAVRDVPGRYATIQAAVDAARPGDLVRIAPGRYRESVQVPAAKRNLVIRGLDRNRVVLDGERRRVDGLRVRADGVSVENLTVRGYVVNGLLFAPPPGGPTLTGYRASYVTAANNGVYGIYALGATRGQFDHLYASGHPDSGVYIGQCSPCRAVVTDSVAEHNMVGFEGTNASGALAIVRSTWRANRVGVVLESAAKEKLAPQHDAQVVGNVVTANNDARAPRGGDEFGLGILVTGGGGNAIERNRVAGHRGAGILLEAGDDGHESTGNRVRDNVLAANRVDLAVRGRSDLATLDNCFAGNRFARSLPPGIETALRCGRPARAVAAAALDLPAAPGGRSRVPLPPPQPGMPNARTAPPRPAVGLPARIDLAAVGAPEGP